MFNFTSIPLHPEINKLKKSNAKGPFHVKKFWNFYKGFLSGQIHFKITEWEEKTWIFR